MCSIIFCGYNLHDKRCVQFVIEFVFSLMVGTARPGSDLSSVLVPLCSIYGEVAYNHIHNKFVFNLL